MRRVGAGRGRGGYYFDSHLQKLLQIKELQAKGLKLASILQYLQSSDAELEYSAREVWTRCEITPGLEIHVNREFEEKERQKILEIMKIARMIIERERI